MSTAFHPHDAEALSARLGGRIAGALNEHSDRLPHDIQSRLRFAREQALARRAKAAPASAVAAWATGSTAVLGGGPGRPSIWRPLAALAPVLLLLVGLVVIDQWQQQEELRAAADIDALLLADDLPPAAHSDPGFAEFLRSPPP
jgi:hypothetical protein